MHITTLFHNDDLLAVHKPTGISTHAPQTDPYPSDLLSAAEAQLGRVGLRLHQRLDRDTSGVLVLAASEAGNQLLAAAFEGRAATKRYLAIVHGVPRKASGMIDAPLAETPGGLRVIAQHGDTRAQQARTGYRVLAAAPDRRWALLELLPETGRTHQLRVHLRHIGHPIVGDQLYDAERPAPRLMLHAATLSFPIGGGERLTLEAPQPAIFATVAQGLPALALAEQLRAAGDAAPQLLEDEPAGLRDLLALAVERRQPLAADERTTAYRMINGEADGLPGLTADLLEDTLVVSFYDQQLRHTPQRLRDALVATINPANIYVKYRPRQASRLSDEERQQIAPERPVWGGPTPELTILEDGLRYLIRPGAGLSTGLFLDMREGRGRVRRWAEGKRVLNCFAYTCGFGLAASAGGAADVLNIDAARPALEWGKENYRLNGMEPPQRGFLSGDVFEHLERFGRKGHQFDLVILDPPAFATTRRTRFSGAKDYGKLALLAAQVTAPGGILLACSNHAGVERRTFRRQLLDALAERAPQVIGHYGAPALDFPALGESYLKILALQLDSR